MKKSLLSILILAASNLALAGGKEVIQEPVKPVVIKEVVKEVPVYQTKTVKNGGYINTYYEWRGKSTKHKKGDHEDYLPSNYGFLHLEGEVNTTENQKFYFEMEDYHALNSPKDNDKWETDDGHTDIELDYTIQHGFLGGMASKLMYKNNDSVSGGLIGDSNVAEYMAQWNLAEKMFNNDFIKTDDFTFGPKIGYNWNNREQNTDYGQDIYYGLDLYSTFLFPLNFSVEFNLYFTEHNYNDKIAEGKDNDFTIGMEAYLYNTTPLVEFGDATLSFYFEGGYDPFEFSQRKIFAHDLSASVSGNDDKYSYTLYALPGLKLDYKATDDLTLFLLGGARMENIHTAGCEAQGYQWQPVAQIGFNFEF